MNEGSVADFLQIIKSLNSGERFARTVSNKAAEVLLSRIEMDTEGDGLERAIAAFDQHIDYYEGLNRGNRPGLRAVIKKWRIKVQKGRSFDQYLEEFDSNIEVASKLSVGARAKLLPPIGHKPKARTMAVKVYARNAAVVAEVLARAKGTCEGCGQAAPFKRATDGSPYLEVHHKTKLADNGDDTVENAEALCPNCHRQRHFG